MLGNFQINSTILFSVPTAFVSTSGKDARSKYAYFYNKPKQVKSKKTPEQKEAIRQKRLNKNKFELDTTKPIKELLAYSDKKSSFFGI